MLTPFQTIAGMPRSPFFTGVTVAKPYAFSFTGTIFLSVFMTLVLPSLSVTSSESTPPDTFTYVSPPKVPETTGTAKDFPKIPPIFA